MQFSPKFRGKEKAVSMVRDDATDSNTQAKTERPREA